MKKEYAQRGSSRRYNTKTIKEREREEEEEEE